MSNIQSNYEINQLLVSLELASQNLDYLRKKMWRYGWTNSPKYLQKRELIRKELVEHIKELVDMNDLKEEVLKAIDCL